MKTETRTINWERFKHLCFEAEVIEIGDHRMTNSEIGDHSLTLEFEPNEPGQVVQCFFDHTCFPAEVDAAGQVTVKDLDGFFNEITFRSTKVIEP